MNLKKQRELGYLTKFLSILGEMPTNIACQESPDFIIEIDNKRIGVELTKYHWDAQAKKGSPRHATEVEWAVLQAKIKDMVSQCNDLQQTLGYLCLKNCPLPPRKDFPKFVNEIQKFAVEKLKSGNKEMRPGRNYPLLTKHAKKLDIKTGVSGQWRIGPRPSSVAFNENTLLNAIRTKADKAKEYKKQSCHELWLLVASTGETSGEVTPPGLSDALKSFHKVNNLLQRTEFDKAYLYQAEFDEIYEWPGWHTK